MVVFHASILVVGFFGISGFSGFDPDFGLVISGIVLHTCAVFLKVWPAVHDLHYGRILGNVRTLWIFGFSQFLLHLCVCFGMFGPGICFESLRRVCGRWQESIC